MFSSIIVIIMIIPEQVLTAGEGPVQWEQWWYSVITFMTCRSSRSTVVLSNLVLI